MDIDQFAESPLEPTTDALFSDCDVSFDYFKSYRRTGPINPEVALYLAVLETGIEDYCKSLDNKTPAGQRLFKEVEEWFFSGDEDWYFSFENVCAALSIDPGYVRRGLRRYYHTHSPSSRGEKDAA
jgi:hypothetical protein